MSTLKSLLGATALALALSSALAAPPVAPVRDVPENLHGTTVHDPYRYFENIKDTGVQAWLKGQGDYARQVLDRIEGRAALEKRIAEYSASAGDSINAIVRMPGDKIFYLKRPRGERQFKLVMREGLQGAEKVLVDPEAETARTGTPHAVNYFVPSWDGQHVAYGMSAGGSEDASLYVLNIASGKQVGAPIPRVHEKNVSWTPDSRALTFNQLKPLSPEDSETETYLDSRVLWLALGQPESAAKPIFGPTVTPQLGLARLDVGAILFAPGSPWMIARTSDTTWPEGAVFVAPVTDLAQPAVRWKRIASFDDHIVDMELKGDDLIFKTRKDAPRYKLMKLDLRNPVLARAQPLALPPAGGVIESFVVGRDAVVASVRDGTAIGLRRYRAGDTAGHAIALPVAGGAAFLNEDPAHAYGDVLYTLSSWSQLAREWRLDGETSTDTGLRKPGKLPASIDLQVTQVKVRSHDGAMVPMTIIHRKGLKRDGTNPTLLDAYGSYGHTISAFFNPNSMAWIEQGGVLAYSNVRGSGVYGEPWRQAGFKTTKPNTWKDGVASARYLIEQGYASPKTLGVMGTSAGGIFVGRVVTSAPQLFAAAIFNVGVMDAVRAEESANGITNISEFGSYKNPKEFPALLEMSTYHQIQDGTPYPAVMAIHGLNDPRVDVWHSAKAIARLQAASNSGKPVILRTDAQAGHGMGSTATQRNAMSADIYSFLLWQMGKRRAE
ncbi:prolyl oligopeptidase family serine peptidase [Caenimonas aquaedulcis]|uniref:prolyl oligopeptidase n=1 Tax=Caenimonas aquaedulcis TaxID=2793270 RepID=A0A931H5X0_9BURK|nr:prolyl oligopeptidase family serine peptidase [Caenimonas aquaedulcis]MBG9388995.1 prolyl oligopeptidase family serine peptidase [Caenimonas aquaedulcis]